MPNIKEIYIDCNCHKDTVEVFPEYVYMTIPADYVCIYHKILTMYADFGVEMLNDCSASCTDKNKNVVNCYNMFNAAVAARKLGNNSLANTLIKYIEGQLNIQYNNDAPCPEVVYPITKDGKIYAMIGCGEKPKFYVSPEDGKLYEEYKDNNDSKLVYYIKDNNLCVKS